MASIAKLKSAGGSAAPLYKKAIAGFRNDEFHATAPLTYDDHEKHVWRCPITSPHLSWCRFRSELSMSRSFGNLIGGEWSYSGQLLRNVNPSDTGDTIGEHDIACRMVAVFREPRADPRGSDHDVVAMMQVQCRHRSPTLPGHRKPRGAFAGSP
jgi:hypothetical protein